MSLKVPAELLEKAEQGPITDGGNSSRASGTSLPYTWVRVVGDVATQPGAERRHPSLTTGSNPLPRLHVESFSAWQPVTRCVEPWSAIWAYGWHSRTATDSPSSRLRPRRSTNGSSARARRY